jgi:hypothetical protein
MTREEEYRLTLAHVVRWLGGDGGFDAMKPVSARTANGVIFIVSRVLDGATLEQATADYQTAQGEQ